MSFALDVCILDSVRRSEQERIFMHVLKCCSLCWRASAVVAVVFLFYLRIFLYSQALLILMRLCALLLRSLLDSIKTVSCRTVTLVCVDSSSTTHTYIYRSRLIVVVRFARFK